MTGGAVARWLLAAALLVAVWLALDLLLLVFAGVLLAIFLRTLSSWTARVLRIAHGAALLLVLLALIGGAAGAAMLYAPTLAEQVDQLTTEIPRSLSELGSRVREYSWGRWVLGELSGGAPSGQQMVQRASRAASTLAHAVTAVVVVLFVGLYLAAEPAPYIRGILHLFPRGRRRRVAEVLYACGHTLRSWLLGQALAMVLVGAAMGIGLALIGVRLSFLLGVLAGLFEFIPVLGPLLGLAPALMLALADGARPALFVLVLYGVVQAAEGYVITPLVQRRAVQLPPVVTITAQLALAWLAGPVGLLTAVPLVAVVMVSVQMLYVSDVLKDRVDPELERTGREAVDQAARGPLKDVLPKDG